MLLLSLERVIISLSLFLILLFLELNNFNPLIIRELTRERFIVDSVASLFPQLETKVSEALWVRYLILLLILSSIYLG